MECVPRCIACTGLCSAVAPRRAARVSSSPSRPAPVSRPTQFRLTCGHLTTPKEQTVWRDHAPKGKPYWCDGCSKWCRKEKPANPVTQPDIPPF